MGTSDVVETAAREHGPALVGYAYLLTGEPGDSIQMGVLHYLGEGAYEGLQLTYYFAGRVDGDNRGYDIVGWIEPVD